MLLTQRASIIDTVKDKNIEGQFGRKVKRNRRWKSTDSLAQSYDDLFKSFLNTKRFFIDKISFFSRKFLHLTEP